MDTIPVNLRDLISRLPIAEGKTNEEILNAIVNIVGPEIKLRYLGDKIQTIDDSKDFIMETKKSRFSAANNYTLNRILLTSSKYADYRNELVRQCNGIVLEFGTWKVLALPCHRFDPNLGKIDINEFKIYEIKDGTTVTLYWYDDLWRLSTTNGIEMNTLTWIGDTPYFSAFNEAARSCPKFSLDILDHDCSYTIGFRHNDFHPLHDLTTPKIWLIKVTDLTSLEDRDCDIGIPWQTLVTLPEGDNVSIFRWMREKNESAMTKYLTQKSIHYGYVLRSDRVDYVLESELLKSIKSMIYNLPKNQYNANFRITSSNRIQYSALRAYLGKKSKHEFSALFPQYSKYYATFDPLISRILEKITASIRGTRRRSANPDTLESNLDAIADVFVKHLLSDGVNTINKENVSVIKDFIHDTSYTSWYFTCLILIPSNH